MCKLQEKRIFIYLELFWCCSQDSPVQLLCNSSVTISFPSVSSSSCCASRCMVPMVFLRTQFWVYASNLSGVSRKETLPCPVSHVIGHVCIEGPHRGTPLITMGLRVLMFSTLTLRNLFCMLSPFRLSSHFIYLMWIKLVHYFSKP